MTENTHIFAASSCPHAVTAQDVAITLCLNGEAETAALAARLAPYMRGGDVLALWGTLGAGKSALSRGLIRALTSADEEVPSPTFTLVQIYEPDAAAPVWHFDLYRIEDPDEIWELGFEDALHMATSLIEWPARMGGYLPKQRLDVVIEFAPEIAETARRITLVARGSAWAQRLQKMELASE